MRHKRAEGRGHDQGGKRGGHSQGARDVGMVRGAQVEYGTELDYPRHEILKD